MSQMPENLEPQQPDVNSNQQADSSITNNEVKGNQNRVIQGNNNQSVTGGNNTVNQGNNNTQNINIITNNYYLEKVVNASVKSVEETKNTLQNKGCDFNAEPEKEVRARPKLKPSHRKYRFEYAEVVKPSGLFGFGRKPIINSHRKEAKYFIEDLGGGVELEMIAIPEGNFFMGSLEEKNATSSEFPRHLVSVNSFFIGKYPITQKQWKAVAYLPQINRPLVVDCSKFKGDSYPVEQICWDNAVEFCDRLSQKTNRDYRLPSEAEWEYACRAGTTTPFHFGDIITPELANYNYYEDTKSSREFFHNQTTPVDNFKFPNLLGLYDMHGLVWEWCMDHWHDSYKKAPNDGKAWVNNRDNQLRVIRGGSWADIPVNCRSASRKKARIDEQGNYLGFRVVCC
ncbi:formylglycine-generating enzyme family protein (plasmid) [Nostoc sp. UHCC 0926]|uniref:formylglycine-generating enzyme family protein n=1 Tax=Nostoc sp. UHCC 0926 TaxID=3025190 RepID=UPI002360274E|nr:formylglycine-generating enzyme family protein [Nostoc sp. UHCC 0926]WDD36094.1 formylglycine-generating enzyme family protein [Nostoc sp. UHCC 0926]